MSPERQATWSLPGPRDLPVLETETRPSAPSDLGSRISVICVLVYFILSSPLLCGFWSKIIFLSHTFRCKRKRKEGKEKEGGGETRKAR